MRMTRTLRHRGPDDEGFYVEGGVGLGHRRLAILDLTPTGHQPMKGSVAGGWLAYNGEIYDHVTHRERLVRSGFTFQGTSDTETLLALLETEGVDSVARVAGIFAFAYFDTKQRRLLLVRDPLGVKQLYYHDDGSRIAFASEIKALLCDPRVPRSADPEAVNEYIHFYTPLFDRTFFRDVHQLRAGEVVAVSESGVSRRLYGSPFSFAHEPGSDEERILRLRHELGTVVKDQLLSDVPVGVFLSGGVDSSAIAAFAKRAEPRTRCFGVHFTDQGVIDERPYQESVARSLGVPLELVTLDGRDFPADLARAMYFQDEPVIGPALLPMYHVSRLAARHVKVCLGGQASDEIFGGYARYALVDPLRALGTELFRRLRRPGSAGAPASGVVARREGNLLKQLDSTNFRRLLRGLKYAFDWRERYFANFAKVPERAWRGIFRGSGFVSRARARQTYEDALNRSPASLPADKVLHWDVQSWLTGLFHQDDRMSMASSLESRVPFADPRLVRFAFGCGFDLKLRDGATKWILRQAIADLVPPEVLTRRKVGFDTPAADWMRGRHADFVRDLLCSARARTRGFWDPRAVEALLDRSSVPFWFDIVWKLASIEMWARLFLDGDALRTADGEPTRMTDLH